MGPYRRALPCPRAYRGIDRLGILQELTNLISNTMGIDMRKLNIEASGEVFACDLVGARARCSRGRRPLHTHQIDRRRACATRIHTKSMSTFKSTHTPITDSSYDNHIPPIKNGLVQRILIALAANNRYRLFLPAPGVEPLSITKKAGMELRKTHSAFRHTHTPRFGHDRGRARHPRQAFRAYLRAEPAHYRHHSAASARCPGLQEPAQL